MRKVPFTCVVHTNLQHFDISCVFLSAVQQAPPEPSRDQPPPATGHANPDQALERRQFPSRPSADGNDGLTDDFPPLPLLPAPPPPRTGPDAPPANSPPPPQRLQPDGSELRQRLAVQPSFAAPPSRPDRETTSAPPATANRVNAVQRQHLTAHAESPVSQLLGPNFKAAQQVLDLLKQDRLLGRGGDSGLSAVTESHSPGRAPSAGASDLSTAGESGVSSGGPVGTGIQPAGRPYAGLRPSHSSPSRAESAYSQTSVGAEILREMEQRYGTSPPQQTGHSSLTPGSGGLGTDVTPGSGRSVAGFELSGEHVISESDSSGRGVRAGEAWPRDLSPSGGRAHQSAEKESGMTASRRSREEAIAGAPHRRGATADTGHARAPHEGPTREHSFPSAGDGGEVLGSEHRVQSYHLTEDHARRPGGLSAGDAGFESHESRGSSLNTTGSHESAPSGAEMPRRVSDRSNFRSSGLASDASSNDTDELLNYDAAAESDLQYLAGRRARHAADHAPQQPAGKSDREGSGAASRSASENSLGQVLDPGGEDDWTQYHKALGAGVVTPLQDDVTSAQSNSSVQTPTENSSSSRESLRVQDIEAGETDESPSSADLYQPVLAAAPSQAASYGIYDIRRSSGPGSTNRRRRALGLDPLSARARPTRADHTVYVSGGSTPVAPDDGKATPGDSARSSSSDLSAFEPQQVATGRTKRPGGGEKWAGPARQWPRVGTAGSASQAEDTSALSSSAQLQNSRAGSAQAEEGLRPTGASDGVRRGSDWAPAKESPASDPPRFQASWPAGATATTRTSSRRASDGVRQGADWAPGFTPSTGHPAGESVASTGGASTQRTQQRFPAAKRPNRRELASSKAPYIYDSDTLTSGTESLDSNISKLSQMILRPLSDRASLSSQASVSTPVERAWAPRGGLTGSAASSEPSSSSVASSGSGFVGPDLSRSVEQQLRLRELLKNLGSRQALGGRLVPASVGESSTETGSLSGPGSTFARSKQKKTASFKETSPLPKRGKHKRSAKASYVKDRRGTAAQCICGQREQPQKAREARGRSRDVFTMARPTRDVAVGATPGVTSDEDDKRTEDACTQTDPLPGAAEQGGQREGRRDETPADSHACGRRSHETPADRRPVLLTAATQRKSPQGKQRRVAGKEPDQGNGAAERDQRFVASENRPPLSPRAAADPGARRQDAAWFYPVSNAHFSQPTDARLDHFQVALGGAARVPEALQKLSLQEAFMAAKPDFIQRSRARLSHVKDAAKAQRRPLEDALHRENAAAAENRSPNSAGKSTSAANKLRQNCGEWHTP